MQFSDSILSALSGAGGALSSALGFAVTYVRYFFQWITGGSASFGEVYIVLIRFVMPVLAIGIVLSVIWRMIRVKNPTETWGYLYSDELGRFPIRHWECTVGRARHCDIIVKFATVSRTQCAFLRDDDGNWFVQDLGSRGTTLLNGEAVSERTAMPPGSELNIGGVTFKFHSITAQELEIQQNRREKESRPRPPWKSFIALTVFQILTVIEFAITKTDEFPVIALCFAIFSAAMWTYIMVTRAMGQRGFEPEILAFFAVTMNLAVTATSTPGTMLKQTAAILIGIIIYVFLGWYLRDLDRVVKTRNLMAGLCIALFAVNLIFGGVHYGARNWISVAGLSLQPSELAKICFIFAGAATLDRLFVKHNLYGFMALSGLCLVTLAVTGDFGTASIFFVVFLVIAFMRSGDYTTLILICGAVAGAALMVIRFKPYVASRFAVWGNAWQFADSSGYQQVRTMSASASGGLIGVGAGNGWLHNVAASNTDLVFGILCEEWGLIIALLAVASIIALSLFAYRVIQTGRSSYYAIAACAATSLFVFQTILNVFGSLDILPLTGVTFPFVSCGGSSMISSWGLLAFLKAADTRQNASFAVNRHMLAPSTPEEAGYTRVSSAGPENSGASYSRGRRSPADQNRPYNDRSRSGADSAKNTIGRSMGPGLVDDDFLSSIGSDTTPITESKISPEDSLTDEDKRTMEQNQHEIDDFLSQFDDSSSGDIPSHTDIENRKAFRKYSDSGDRGDDE